MKILNLLFVMLIPFLGACNSDEPNNRLDKTPEVPDENITIELSRSEQDIVKAQNRFALRFYNAVVANSKDPGNTNITLSPLSAQICLSMLANGASGDLYDSLMEEFGATDVSELNDFCNRMLSGLPTLNPSKVSIGFNNALWENTAVGGVNASFKSVLESMYGSKVFSMDFRNNDMQGVINSWVKGETGGLIENIVPRPVNPESALALANTFSFEGKWKEPFDQSKTGPSDFYNLEGSKTSEVMMMHSNIRGYYHKLIPGVKIYSLIYGNGSYRMEIFVPDKNKSPWETVNLYDGEMFENYSETPSNSVYIDLKMPRFDVNYNEEITKVLEDMGITISGEDLMRISESSTDLNTYHATHVINNEEGTKIVVSTVVSGGLMADHTDNVSLELNRPFAYLIREASTGAILFIGHIANPAEN